MTRVRGRFATIAAALVGCAVAITWTAVGASAHVTVAAPGVTVGASDATIIFRAPTESATASTVGLKLQLPTATPLAGVLVAPIPGWTAKITQTTLPTAIHTDDGDITQVVSEIDWTATDGGIKPGFFGQFTIIVGQLPDNTSALTFKAIQQYSDGKVVSWIQQAAPGSTDEPDFPAPTLTLPAASPASSGTGSATAPVALKAPNAASKSAATTGIVLGALGLLLGLVALGLVLVSRRSSRQP